MAFYFFVAKVSLSIFASKKSDMNIFAKLITYDKNGKCENPVALKERQEREKLAYRIKTMGRWKVLKLVEVRKFNSI